MEPSMQDLGLAVKRLQWRHHRESNRALAAIGLSLVQWDVLRHLHRDATVSLHALAELTFQTDQSMGELARRMVDRGLIERLDCPGRAIRHRLTAQGRQAYTDGADLVDAVLTQSVGQLTPTERATLHALLVKAANRDDNPVNN